MDRKRENRLRFRSFSVEYHLVLGLIAVVTMLLTTLSSPLYPLNDWVDSNAFFTMGKSMFNGKVLYRDVFDHKGPILHFLHGVAWLISRKSFFGVWILEVIACYFTLLSCYRILELYTDKRAILMMPIFSVFLYTTHAMAKGDSAEELCLPLLMFGVFLVFRSLKEKKDISAKNLFWLGVTSGTILWIKYTMLGFYLGWIVLPMFFAIKNKNWKYILNMVLFVGAGVLAITLPVLLYFLVNGALYDLWDVYFYTNIFQYATDASLLDMVKNVLSAARQVFVQNIIVMHLLMIGGVWAVLRRKYLLVGQLALMLAGGLVAIYSKASPWPYYAVIFCGFSIFGFIPVYSKISGTLGMLNRKLYAGILIVACLLIVPADYFMSENTEMLQYEKEDLPQFQFAQIINQKEDATVLNCGFMDGGFYTASGVVPSTRHFCMMNVDVDEAFEEQKEALHQGAVDFVIMKNSKLTLEQYEEVMVSTFSFQGWDNEYTLYRRKSG